MNANGYYHGGIIRTIFPDGYELLPNTNQLWEIDMAYGELQSLGGKERQIERSAFFARIDGCETHHYKICKASPLQVDKESSIRRQTFFDVNQYKTGYATHGLFPYRGKFHPQLVKAVLNLIRLEKGDTVLDPMAGSGTLCIEAAINGINSIGIDVSPFCSLMTRAKTQALNLQIHKLKAAFEEKLEDVAAAQDRRGQGTLFQDGPKERGTASKHQNDPYRDILLLCYLDAMGYAARRVNKTGKELFPVVATRYLAAIGQFQKVRGELDLPLGKVDARTGDCRHLDISDNSVDAIVTSPPYSFAIDYAENDRPQLEYLGYEPNQLKEEMIGLIGGKSIQSRVRRYFQDMQQIFAEMARVLKKGKCCVVVIGSNEIQTGGIRHEVEFAKFGKEVGFRLFWKMVRPIEGIHNSMRDEYVMFFQKE
jgi:SAM-dependent methyltransferase